MQICCLATGVICRIYSYADFELPDIGELFFVVIDKTFLLQSSTQATVQIPMRNHKIIFQHQKQLLAVLSRSLRIVSTCNKNSKTLAKI